MNINKLKISKELLSEIMQLGILEVGEVNDCYLSFNYYIQEGDNIQACINVYELAYKCKEWVLKQGYYFSIYSFNFSDNIEQEHRIRLLRDNEVVYYGNDSCKETEPEATVQACEWVIKQKGENK